MQKNELGKSKQQQRQCAFFKIFVCPRGSTTQQMRQNQPKSYTETMI
jgi:hypothetical protein